MLTCLVLILGLDDGQTHVMPITDE